MSSDSRLIPYVMSQIPERARILDVACGKGKWGFLALVDKNPSLLVGVDIFLPYLKFVKSHQVYDEVILCDALFLPFLNQCFDTVLACEVIEHLPREKGNELLKEIERLTKNTVIITTPSMPISRKTFIKRQFEGNIYEEHMSRWTVKELRSKGYSVKGIGFMYRVLKRPQLSLLLTPIAYVVPWASDLLLAIKKVSRRVQAVN